MKILGIIPARGSSKGIPRKNIKLLGGKPLIFWTIESSLNSILNRVIVSTEDVEIANISKHYGAEVLMRPMRLSQDTTPTLDVLQHILSQIDCNYDAVMTLQPTSPFRKTCHIDESIRLFEKNSEADSLVSVVQIPHQFSPNSAMVIDPNGWAVPHLENSPLITRRQEKPIFFARNGAAIYITRTNNIKEFVFGGNVLPYLMKKIESIDLDDLEDWILAEALMESTNYEK
jgi:N-acylneuraminate cytidylyltransferase